MSYTLQLFIKAASKTDSEETSSVLVAECPIEENDRRDISEIIKDLKPIVPLMIRRALNELDLR